MSTLSKQGHPEHLADRENDSMPLLGRVFEVQAAQQLDELEPAGSLDQAHLTATPDDVDSAAPGNYSGQHAESGTVMPFLGHIISHVPGQSIVIERNLNLAEDLYLADHAFVHAQSVKPLSTCLPVLPMTFSLEVMAEAAACLIPGQGLIGLEDIKATRWIELADTDELPLRISAGPVQHDAEQQLFRIDATICIKGQNQPAISARVLFATHYRADLEVGFSRLTEVSAQPATQVYQQRHMFHGPRLHCLTGEIHLGNQGATADLAVQPHDDLFQSVPEPQLLLDPAMLDGIGQLIGVWTIKRINRAAFPIGFKKLELYRPAPPAGTRVPVRIEITRNEVKTLFADIEIEDGQGAVWMRIHDWGMWKFRWAKKLSDFRRLPTRYQLSDPVKLQPHSPDFTCRMLSSGELTGFDAGLLARHYLNVDEFALFSGKAEVPKRQQQWLLGRIAAKDAVRAWVAAHLHAEEMLHPASFAIDNNEIGQPVVTGDVPEFDSLQARISIAHCDERAIAIAHSGPVGVDIERISRREAGFLETISSDSERALLNSVINPGQSPGLFDEWVTRIWCAKEVAGKLLGTGVDAPQHFEVTALARDGMIQILARNNERPVFVSTIREDDFIIAHAVTRARIG